MQEQQPQRRPSHERERDHRRDHRDHRERDGSRDRWDNNRRQRPPEKATADGERELQWANPANPNAAGPRGPPQPPRIGQETGWRQTSAFGAMNRQPESLIQSNSDDKVSHQFPFVYFIDET